MATPDAITNTSPLLYLHRIGKLEWLPRMFGEIWTPPAVQRELSEGRERGFDAPEVNTLPWLKIVEPRSVPSPWLSLDLGAGEREAMALGLENPTRVLLLDDTLARRVAHAAGLPVWGTLKVLLAAKSQGLTAHIAPHVDSLERSGMWISADVRQRILKLAREAPSSPETK